MFITKEDFNITIRPYEIDQITGGDDSIIDMAISAAIGEMKPYLFRYDTDKIFAASGSERHSLLVRFAVDIAVFELVSIARPDQDLENRRALYKRAIDWLKQVKNEEMPVDLPLKEEAPDDDKLAGGILAGSHLPRQNYF